MHTVTLFNFFQATGYIDFELQNDQYAIKNIGHQLTLNTATTPATSYATNIYKIHKNCIFRKANKPTKSDHTLVFNIFKTKR
jgi:hypothetical protein